MYKLYVDRNENFECELTIKNASLKNSVARLMLETKDINLVFNGKIENGKCVVPVKKLKGFLEENASGKMHLEIIVEDTYFKPWESDFVVEEHTSVKVQIKEQSEPTKPIVEVKSVTKYKPTKENKKHAIDTFISKEIAGICEKFGITSQNIKSERRNDFKQIVNEYFKSNPEYIKEKVKIITGVSHWLQ